MANERRVLSRPDPPDEHPGSLSADRVRVWPTQLPSSDGLGVACRKTLSSVVGDGAIDDRPAIDALPGVKNEKEI